VRRRAVVAFIGMVVALPLGAWLTYRSRIGRPDCGAIALEWLETCANKGLPPSLGSFSVESIAENAGLSHDAVREKIQAGCLLARLGSDNRVPDKFSANSPQCGRDDIVCTWSERGGDDAVAFACAEGRVTRMSLLEGNGRLLLSDCKRCAWPPR
jgi:hypothetical protein